MFCEICKNKVLNIESHVLEEHNTNITNYLEKYPNTTILSDKNIKYVLDSQISVKRCANYNFPDEINIYDLKLKVNKDVSLDFCLPYPEYYFLPKEGKMKDVLENVAISLKNNRSIYVWGFPGTGKDAFFHAYSYLTRTPAEIYTIRPGEDIQSWFFNRSFNSEGTYWEEGTLLKKIRDGYITPEGKNIPYMIIFSDFDRADKNQLESLRLILDSIYGRIKGPQGTTYSVLKGTQFIFTANSSGSGDHRGRCISANPIDASIFERIERKYQFYWMSWADEKEILKRKFPVLSETFIDIFNILEKISDVVRKAINNEELFFEFGHRILCSWLGHAQDIITTKKKKYTTSEILKVSSCCWIDSLSDPETQIKLQRLIDPYINKGFL